MKSALGLLLLFLTGCATGYNPNNAAPTKHQTPAGLNCPTGSIMMCEVEGGGLVGKTYTNCECRQ